MINIFPGLMAIIGTVILYYFANLIYKRYPMPTTLPILTATLCIIIFLLILKIPYETYMIGGQWIDHLLGPSVVALAYPLHKNWKLLTTYIGPLLIAVFTGSVIGVGSGLLLSKWSGFDQIILISIASKSVTTPVSMEIAQNLGGAPSIAAIFVIIAGVSGAVFGPLLLKYSFIKNRIAKGVGIGSASHAIGTARVMADGELEGSASSVAMTISAIIVAVITPLLVFIIL